MARMYRCKACSALSPTSGLARGAWGDPACPACGSPDVERHRSRFARWYAIFFLYKVY